MDLELVDRNKLIEDSTDFYWTMISKKVKGGRRRTLP